MGDREQYEKLVAELANIANVIGFDETGAGIQVAQSIMGKHRTIQQVVIGILLNAIVYYGENALTDGRNEYSKELCGFIAKTLKENGYLVTNDGLYMPFI